LEGAVHDNWRNAIHRVPDLVLIVLRNFPPMLSLEDKEAIHRKLGLEKN